MPAYFTVHHSYKSISPSSSATPPFNMSPVATSAPTASSPEVHKHTSQSPVSRSKPSFSASRSSSFDDSEEDVMMETSILYPNFARRNFQSSPRGRSPTRKQILRFGKEAASAAIDEEVFPIDDEDEDEDLFLYRDADDRSTRPFHTTRRRSDQSSSDLDMIWDVEDDIDSSRHSEGIDIISPATTVDIRSLSGSSILSDTYMRAGRASQDKKHRNNTFSSPVSNRKPIGLSFSRRPSESLNSPPALSSYRSTAYSSRVLSSSVIISPTQSPKNGTRRIAKVAQGRPPSTHLASQRHRSATGPPIPDASVRTEGDGSSQQQDIRPFRCASDVALAATPALASLPS